MKHASSPYARLTLQLHVNHWVPFCYVAAISETEPGTFLLSTNREGSVKQRTSFAFCLLYPFFTSDNHIELGPPPSMQQTHCIIFSLLENRAFCAPIVFFTKAFAICFPVLLHIKNIWGALKNTDLECTGLG